MRKVLALLGGGALALSTVVSSAQPAAAACDGMLFGTVVEVGGAAYVDVREVAGETYLYSIWIYVESNGTPGLQRGGSDPTGAPDSCQESANPDTLIF